MKLHFLVPKHDYRYQIDNCLFDEVIREILWYCKCIPEPFSTEVYLFNGYKNLPNCQGSQLLCANEKIEIMGQNSRDDYHFENDINFSLENSILANLTKPPRINCLPACTSQKNMNEMSEGQYPTSKNILVLKRSFCDVASHIFQRTCSDEIKRIYLEKGHPKLCNVLQKFEEYFDANSSCENWPESFLKSGSDIDQELINEVYDYSRKNLAYIKIMIQSPYVTKYKRDLSMTLLSYVANTGGLLGVCLGFSCISGIEIFYWIFCCFYKMWKNGPDL